MCSISIKKTFIINVLAILFLQSANVFAGQPQQIQPGVAIGPQYDSTHVYVAPADLDTFVKSFVATFGGQPSKPVVSNVTPVNSSSVFRYIMSPVGMISVFAYNTPVPYPFKHERYGYLVSNMDQAINEARAAGAEIVVTPYNDPIGKDAIIQWPGGIKTQLYWHFTPPNYPALKTIPDNRVYVSADRADEFVRDFLKFSHGKVVEDNKQADGAEIGRPDYKFRRIRIESPFGKMQVMVTDGHLPYPFGHEITGYQVDKLSDTLTKASNAGVKILSQSYNAGDRNTAIVQFPGGYIAEIHDLKKSN